MIGCSAAFHLAEAGVDVVLLERDAARERLDLPSCGRRPRAVLRRAEHRDRPAQPARLPRVRAPARLGDRLQAGRLPVRPQPGVGRRGVRAQRRAAERATACPPGSCRRRRRASCARCSQATTSSPRPSRPKTGTLTPEAVVQGYALWRPGARRAHPRRLRGARHRARRAARSPRSSRRTAPIRTGTVDLRRGRLVSQLRRDGGRRAARHSAAPPGAVHRADQSTCHRICR